MGMKDKTVQDVTEFLKKLGDERRMVRKYLEDELIRLDRVLESANTRYASVKRMLSLMDELP